MKPTQDRGLSQRATTARLAGLGKPVFLVDAGQSALRQFGERRLIRSWRVGRPPRSHGEMGALPFSVLEQ